MSAQTTQEAVEDLYAAVTDLGYVLFWSVADWRWRWLVLGITPSAVVTLVQAVT
jgi:hypothetical protein